MTSTRSMDTKNVFNCIDPGVSQSGVRVTLGVPTPVVSTRQNIVNEGSLADSHVEIEY